MLGKLLKYEFRSISRQFAGIWIAALAVALINGILQTPFGETDSPVSLVMILVYSGVMVALFVITLIFILGRFNSGLLGQEGYLMFTLPVTPTMLVTSKLMASIIVSFVSCIVAFASMILLSVRYMNFLPEFFSELTRLLRTITFEEPALWLTLLETLVLLFVWCAVAVLEIYVAIAVGHLANRHRTALAVGAFIVISSVSSWLMGIIGKAADEPGMDNWLDSMIAHGSHTAATNIGLLLMIALGVFFAAIYFIGTTAIISKKLNLE